MSKMREDSTWNRLTPEQRETLEGWLFEENLGYAKTLERVRQEFGVEATMASLGRFYRRRARERQEEELLEAQEAAFDLKDLPVSVPVLREAVVKLLHKTVLELAIEQPGEVEQLVSVAKLLLASDDIEIRRSKLKLAERYFDYEATAASQKDLPQLRAYMEAISDNTSLSNDEKLERVHAVLYGWDRAKSGVNGQDKPNNGN